MARVTSSAVRLAVSRQPRLDSQATGRRAIVRALLCSLLLGSSLAPDPCHGDDDPPKSARQLVQSHRVLVIAHRGNSSRAPENTLAAFRSALAVGSDLVELDYYHCAEGIPVVVHDRNLERTTNAVHVLGMKAPLVHQRTLAELQLLDAGSWFDRKFANQRIPTLEKALGVIQRGSTTLIERKGGDAKTCVDLLRRLKLLDRVVVQSFDWDYLTACHRLAPHLVLGALGKERLSASRLRSIRSTGARVVGWKHQDLVPEDIQRAHQTGLKIWVYTVNQSQRAKQLIEWGVDGIISDAPAIIQPLTKQAQPPTEKQTRPTTTTVQLQP